MIQCSSAVAKTAVFLMSVSHTSFLNMFPAYQKNCGLKVGPMVITKAILFI